MKRLLLVIVTLTSGLVFALSSPASAANVGSVTVNCNSNAGSVSIPSFSISGDVGDTYTLNNVGNQQCVVDNSDGIISSADFVPRHVPGYYAPTGASTLTIVSSGSFDLTSNGTTRSVRVTASGSSSSSGITEFLKGTFDPNGGTCAFDDTNAAPTLGSIVADDTSTRTLASARVQLGVASPIVVGGRLIAAEMVTDGTGQGVRRARIQVFDADDLSPVSTTTLGADENTVVALDSDGVHLYVAVVGGSGDLQREARLVKFRLDDMSRVATVGLGSDATGVAALTVAHGFAFVAIESFGPNGDGSSGDLFGSEDGEVRIEKIRLATMTRVAQLDVSAITFPITAMAVVGSSLYVTTAQGTFAPAVWRYSAGSMALTGGSFLGAGNPRSMSFDGSDLLIGLANSEIGVAVVDPVSLAVDRSRVDSSPSGFAYYSGVHSSGSGEVTTVSLVLRGQTGSEWLLQFGADGLGSRRTVEDLGLVPIDVGDRVGPYVVHVGRFGPGVAAIRSVLDDVTVSSSPWNYGMVGYAYAPADADCWRDGHVFEGWSADDGVTRLPVLEHEGRRRAFVAASAEYVAQWTPTSTLHLSLVPGSTATVTHGSSSTTCRSKCDVEVTTGSSIVVAATTASDVTFAGFAGDSTSRASSIEIVVEDDAELVVTTTIDEIDISLATTGDGVGAITWGGSATGCSGECAERFTTGSSVTFTAMPNPGSIFTGWGGDCAGTAIGAPCTLTARSGVSVSASFEGGRRVVVPAAPTVGFVASDVQPGILCGGVFAVCDATFPAGTAVTLFGLSSEWTAPRSWTGPCTVTAGACAIDFSSSSTTTVSAVFDDWYQVSSFVSAGSYAVGEVVSNATGSVVAAASAGMTSGRVEVLAWNESTTTYVPLGPPITSSSLSFGSSLALSADGTVLAIGDPNDGSVTILRWNPSTATWDPFGAALDRYQGQQFGFSISLSADGRRLAVGSPGYSSGNKFNLGRVYFFDYVSATNSWSFAASWQGGVSNSRVGHTVALDAAGSTLFVGRPDEFGSGLEPSVDVHRRSADGTWSTATGVSRDSNGFASSIDANDLGNVLSVADASGGAVTVYFGDGRSWNPVGSDVAVGGSWAPVTALSGSGLVVATSGIGSPVSVRSAGLFGWMPRGSTLPWAVALDVNVDGTVIVTSQGVYRFGVQPS